MSSPVRDRGDGEMQCMECGAFKFEHYGNCTQLRPFPIQNGGTIPWWLAEEAFQYYHERWPGQPLERLAERGGFGVTELLMFLRRDEKTKHFAFDSGKGYAGKFARKA